MTTPARDDPRWGVVPLPSQFTEIREQQWDATQQAAQSLYVDGDDVCYLEGPTGSGKSLIAELLRREGEHITGQPIDCNMVTTTKALQDQYAEAFPYGKVIKGKGNYWTEQGALDEFGNPHRRSWSAITCADCTASSPGDDCRWCSNTNFCPYGVAKSRARSAQLAILNTSYWLTDSRYVGHFAGRKLTVLDEADLLEREVLSRVEVSIPRRRLEAMRLEGPKRKTAGEDGKGAVAWASWIRNSALPTVDAYLHNLPQPWMAGVGARDIKEYRATKELKFQLLGIVADVAMGGWVYDGYDEGNVIFRPIRVEKYGSQLLWPSGKKFLIMSATILSADLMNDDLGGYLPYSSISLPSVFPAANRPIYVCDVAPMSKKAKRESDGRTWEEMAKGVRAVLQRHPHDRVLVHTVSYELARFLKDRLKLDPSPPTELSRRPIIIYTSSDEKDEALREYKRQPGAVLLAASMDRGIDLPDELCRVMVVAKIPFLNLGDKRTNARVYSPGGQDWYRSDAIKTLIQMTGRGVRHKDDIAETYILDADFTGNLWKSDWLFPEYWKDAIDWRRGRRWLMGAA